jgi:hypothetical protein
MPNAQGPGLCSTSVDKKDDHVCSMLVHVLVCCNLIRVFCFGAEVGILVGVAVGVTTEFINSIGDITGHIRIYGG